MAYVLKKCELPLLIVLVIAGAFYAYMLTWSPLWLDEAIEYFYSKTMRGESMLIADTSSNMYERIISTYQPPLYNLIMWGWLSIHDSEVWFRSLGVIVTLLGSIPIYKTILLLSNNKFWSGCATIIYLFNPLVAYYALECAEYYLMLCFVSWSLYFFVKYAIENKNKSLYLYFLFAVLAVYSQYGAAIIEGGLFICLCLSVIKRKDVKGIKAVIFLAVATLVFAALPLWYFFLRHQIVHQAGGLVSHVLFFENEHFLKDIVIQYIRVVWMPINIPVHYSILLVAGALLLLPLLKDGVIRSLTLAFVVTFLIYYFLTAMSFYGFNYGYGTFGTENMGGRYGLFIVPLIIVLFLGELYLVAVLFLKSKKVILVVCALLTAVICGFSLQDISNWNQKDYTKDLMIKLEEEESNDENTSIYIDNRAMAVFQYYVMHDDKEFQMSRIKPMGLGFDSESFINTLKREDELGENEFFVIVSNRIRDKVDVEGVLSRNGYKTELLFDEGSLSPKLFRAIKM